MKDKSIENKIDNTLSSIDTIQRAMPAPFFYTRLMARLNRTDQSFWENFSVFVARPAIAFATILLVISINIFAIYSNSLSTDNTSEKTDLAAVDEYSQVSDTIYDIENPKP
jgi:uncharacterized membrane protein YdfJ with MMPL/SSD domain